MFRLINWIKSNKLTSLLILVVLYFLLKQNIMPLSFSSLTMQNRTYPSYETSYDMAAPMEAGMQKSLSLPQAGGGNAPPTTGITDRMVVSNSHLSMVVKSVPQTLEALKNYITGAGGYMVDSYMNNPQDNTNANITFRMPSDKLEEILGFFRSQAVKVTSENLLGTDVTDQYVDNEARMAILRTNMNKFKEIMANAVEISDILRIQQEIFNLQNQIDSIQGQNKYMEQTAKMAKITVYLSTDEFSLPFAPSETWRPDVIFKTAVRSLVKNVRNILSLGIWVLVYSVVWAPVAVLVIYLHKRKKKAGLN